MFAWFAWRNASSWFAALPVEGAELSGEQTGPGEMKIYRTVYFKRIETAEDAAAFERRCNVLATEGYRLRFTQPFGMIMFALFEREERRGAKPSTTD